MQGNGVYRWFETAFMLNPIIRASSTMAPSALPPSPEAAEALMPGIGSRQVAWPFLAFDQGDEGEFIDRWLNWFGLGAEGNLHRPSQMPERSDAQGSWRR
jgi:serine/threonine-protein kinase